MTFALDSNVMIAAVCAWHEHQAIATAAIEDRLDAGHRLTTLVHSITEAYAVLTRLPPPHRLAPGDAWSLVSSNFVEGGTLVGLRPAIQIEMLRDLASSGKGGGRTYDALIATTARIAGVDELLTFNPGHFDTSIGGLTIVGL
ncbi:MAG TPA: PIN domain-containing protein [Vicinamibacterales bacterium]|nr:PIN domain-containing protein [Vicinamibacterales bacterium]